MGILILFQDPQLIAKDQKTQEKKKTKFQPSMHRESRTVSGRFLRKSGTEYGYNAHGVFADVTSYL